MENYSDQQFLNVGSGAEISIHALTEIVSRVIGIQVRSSGYIKTRWHAAQTNG
jgi:hypothetical protein